MCFDERWNKQAKGENRYRSNSVLVVPCNKVISPEQNIFNIMSWTALPREPKIYQAQPIQTNQLLLVLTINCAVIEIETHQTHKIRSGNCN